MLTILRIFLKIKRNECSVVVIAEGIAVMNENEIELVNLIRENNNPGLALMTATIVILGFLKQHGSSEEQVAAALPAHV